MAEPEEISTDLCIVGAGPAGITIARELDNSGVRVCLLVAGGRDVERRFQRQSRGESDGYPIHRLHASRVRALGGTLRHPSFADVGWAHVLSTRSTSRRVKVGLSLGGRLIENTSTRITDALKACVAFARSTSQPRPGQSGRSGWASNCKRPRVRARNLPVSEARFHDAWELLSASSKVRFLLETRAVEIRVDSTGGVLTA
jgi:hypothetical protein